MASPSDVDLARSAAAFVLGTLAPEELPALAMAALESGVESPSVAALAGTPASAGPDELRTLFVEALGELDVALPPPLEAAETLKRHYAARIAAREIAPREGAGLIVELHRKIEATLSPERYVGESFGIAQLVGLFFNYDDVPATDRASIAEIDEAIVLECERLAKEATP